MSQISDLGVANEIRDVECRHAPSVRQDLGRSVRTHHAQERIEPCQIRSVPAHPALRDPGDRASSPSGRRCDPVRSEIHDRSRCSGRPGLQRERPQARVCHGKVGPVEDSHVVLVQRVRSRCVCACRDRATGRSRVIDDTRRRHDGLGRQMEHVQHRPRLREGQRPQNLVRGPPDTARPCPGSPARSRGSPHRCRRRTPCCAARVRRVCRRT